MRYVLILMLLVLPLTTIQAKETKITLPINKDISIGIHERIKAHKLESLIHSVAYISILSCNPDKKELSIRFSANTDNRKRGIIIVREGSIFGIFENTIVTVTSIATSEKNCIGTFSFK